MDPEHTDSALEAQFLLTPSPRPPTPMRQNTSESVGSDTSDGPSRRSALRRSSSSSNKNQSPRRVRFDVAGEEVLPTASPRSSQSLLAEPTTIGSLVDSDDEEAGSEQVEDIDDPPPKRISSSQALRALSRNPLEDGTQWTTVSAPPDGSASVAGVDPMQSYTMLDVLEDFTEVATNTASKSNGNTSHDQDVETPSDDEMLDMPPLGRMKTLRPTATILSPVKLTSSSPLPSGKSPSKSFFELGGDDDDFKGEDDDLELDHDQLFHFDETSNNNGERSPPEEEEQEESSPEASPTPERNTTQPQDFSSLSKSPQPITIPEFSKSPPFSYTASSHPISSARTPPFTAPTPTKPIVGSYKGHPFSLPIVSDELHAQAASLGDYTSFVGSVNGRSGVDEGDARSFRASVGGLGSIGSARGVGKTGGKSMSERLAMDELAEEGAGK